MAQEEIERINNFVDLKSPQSNKHMIKICIFLVIAFFMFFVGDSVRHNYNLLKSSWMIFSVFASSLIIWGLYLLRTLERHQIDFMLYWGVVGTYYSAEFFALGISIGIHDAHINLLLLILIELLDIPLLLWLLWYRIQLFKGKKIKSGSPNYKIMFPLILAFSLVIPTIIKNSSFETAIMPLLSIFLGYMESISVSLFGNYYVAKKYSNYIDLYGEDGQKLSAKKKASQRTKQPKH